MTYPNFKEYQDFQNFHFSFLLHFSDIKDPRRTTNGNFQYPLEEILFLTIASVVSGFKQYQEIRFFGNEKLDWLRKFFPFQNGIPSCDVLERVFARLDHESFGKSFVSWVAEKANSYKGEVIALDGKTARGSGSKHQSAIHVVSAFATKNKLTLAQHVVDEKSNEITAIPKVLDLLTIQGAMVTADAMGCQKEIALKIRRKKADYTLMLKNNQKTLLEQAKTLFENTKLADKSQTHDMDRGRLEIRTCSVITDLKFLDEKSNWEDLKSVIRVEREVTYKSTRKKTFEQAYYISSAKKTAQEFNEIVRSHWAIENNLHWSLDVLFKEDQLLKKKGNSAKNFNLINKIALSMIEKESTMKDSRPIKMHKCALNDDFRESVMNF